jgi:glycosyltransferase involved in cell wall biosynthesis
VVFAGYKSNVADYYTLFDIFVYPSKEEGLGSAILEAFNFKKPVIASNAGGIPDILGNDEYGLLIDPFDDGALAQAIMRLYKNESLRSHYANAGFQRMAFFSVDKICCDYINIYRMIFGVDVI